MGGDMGGLAQLLLMLAAARRQAILGRRSAREELAQKRADRELRQKELQWRLDQQKRQQQQADQEAAAARAKPFLEGLYGKDSADMLADLQAQGRLPEFVQNAAGALGPAGIPFDAAKFLAGLQFQRQETPQADLSVPAPARIEAPGQSINPEAPGLSPLLPVTPAGPVSVPRPPLVSETLPHSAKTQQGAEKVSIAARLAQARLPLLFGQANLANVRAGDITATQPGRIANLGAGVEQKKAATGLTKARTTTEGQRPALLQSQTAATKSIPGYRQGQLQIGAQRNQLTARGQDITAATARRGQDIHREVGLANVNVARDRLAQAAQKSRLDPQKQASFRKYLEIYSAKAMNPLSGKLQDKYSPQDRQRALAGMRRLGQEGGFVVEDVLGVGGGGASSGGTAATGALMNDLQKPGVTKGPKLKAPKQMSVDEILQELGTRVKGKRK